MCYINAYHGIERRSQVLFQTLITENEGFELGDKNTIIPVYAEPPKVIQVVIQAKTNIGRQEKIGNMLYNPKLYLAPPKRLREGEIKCYN